MVLTGIAYGNVRLGRDPKKMQCLTAEIAENAEHSLFSALSAPSAVNV